MSRCELVVGEAGHPYQIIGKMRESDIEELKASYETEPNMVLLESWWRSTYKWAILADREVVAVCGVVAEPDDPAVGIPWLLGTDDVSKIPHSFNRRAREVLDKALTLRPKLANYVMKENVKSVRWLKWLGFSLLPAIPYGPNNVLFHPFYMVKNV